MTVDARLNHERSRFVEDMLAYMTLEEKLGQLDLFRAPDDPALARDIIGGRVGGVCGVALPPRIQSLAIEQSRLGIPLLVIDPAAQLSLSPWALAASWDEDLACAAGAEAARVAIAAGYNCILGPRSGPDQSANDHAAHIRTSEPHLGARLAAAFAQGAAGDSDQRGQAVLAIPSWHPDDGSASWRWAWNLVHDHDINTVDCEQLTRDIAWRVGFGGLLVAECQRICALVKSRVEDANAPSVLAAAETLIAERILRDDEIDIAVRGVLAAKHSLGLFREPLRLVGPPHATPTDPPDHKRLRETFVLLRNEAGLLPFSPVSDRVLVVGALEGVGGVCADALGRAGIGHTIVPGLAQRRPGESWANPVPGDHLALSLTCDAARRVDFVLLALEERHFHDTDGGGWQEPTPATLALLRGLSLGTARSVAVIATAQPVDLATADQHFAAVLHCWRAVAGMEEALSDVLSGRFSPQGRMPVSAGRYVAGHGLGFGESMLSSYDLTAGDGHVEASLRVRNSGSFAMRETVQLYLRDSTGALQLIGFSHVTLAPGEDARVAFELGVEQLGALGGGGRVDLAPGHYEILAGKSAGRLLPATIEITPALARAIMLRERGLTRLAAG